MAGAEANFISVREMREKYGIKLEVQDFVSKMGPCENPNFFLPVPEVPEYLMDPQKAEKAKELLEICVQLANPWGDQRSGKEDPHFKEAANSFKEITGVGVLDIMNEACSRRDEQLDRRP
jgi:hypothetical protein